MKLSNLFLLNAIIATFYGLSLALAPGWLLSLYGLEGAPGERYLAQLFGAALLAFAVISWSFRSMPASDARRAVVLAFFVGDVVGLIFGLLGQTADVLNSLGWVIVLLYLVLAAGFGYFYFVKPAAD